MGVLKRKTAVKGTEGGTKYICDVCSADITSTVRIRCAHEVCKDYDLCVPCFAKGESSRDHHPPTHPYSVIEQHSIPIFSADWGADEEALLIEGAETYGLGSWAEIADHVGGYREKDEVEKHYIDTYVQSSKFPLPDRAGPNDTALTEENPREEFLPRKKRRIEERKAQLAADNLKEATPKQKPTASVPSCHEVAGYMPGRLEFEAEHMNDAEEWVHSMQFEPGEGEATDRATEEEVELKMTIMDVYNSRLTARVERKRMIFEQRLLECKKNMALEKKKQKEERDLFNRAKPFARLMKYDDFQEFTADVEYELNLRQAINVLQEWRLNQISDIETGKKFELEKGQRNARIQALGSYDRFATSRLGKTLPPVETPTVIDTLIASELPVRTRNGLATPPDTDSGPETNGVKDVTTANGTLTPITSRQRFPLQPLSNVAPIDWKKEKAPDLHLLTPDEQEICSVLRLMPRQYIPLKELVFREAHKHSGNMKKKACRELCKMIDSAKAGKLFDFWVYNGWLGKG